MLRLRVLAAWCALRGGTVVTNATITGEIRAKRNPVFIRGNLFQ